MSLDARPAEEVGKCVHLLLAEQLQRRPQPLDVDCESKLGLNHGGFQLWTVLGNMIGAINWYLVVNNNYCTDHSLNPVYEKIQLILLQGSA